MIYQTYATATHMVSNAAYRLASLWETERNICNSVIAALVSIVAASIFSFPLLLPFSLALSSFSLGQIAIKLLSRYTFCQEIESFGLWITEAYPYAQLITSIAALFTAVVWPLAGVFTMSCIGISAAITIETKRCRVLRELRQQEGAIPCQSGL